jgi:hypothetical protein
MKEILFVALIIWGYILVGYIAAIIYIRLPSYEYSENDFMAGIIIGWPVALLLGIIVGPFILMERSIKKIARYKMEGRQKNEV